MYFCWNYHNYIRSNVFMLCFIAFLNHVEDEAGRARLNLSSGHGC